MAQLIRTHRTNTIIYCRRWGETVAFYRDTLGLPAQETRQWIVEFQLTPDSFISVADAARATIAATGGAGLTLAWQVADVKEIHYRLLEKGVDVGPIQTRWGALLFYFRDPEGNRIEIWSQ